MGIAEVIQLRPREQWSLGTAADLALEQHWAGHRKEPNARSWCRQLVEAFPDKTLETFTTTDASTYIRLMQVDGLAPWTVHAKVCAINTLYEVAKKNGYTGPVPYLPRPGVKKPLKWWLTPDKEQEVVLWLRNVMLDREMAHFVAWTVLTGLRVEESLRVTRADFQALYSGTPCLLVPGSKTESAQASIALSVGAAQLACTRFTASCNRTAVTDATPLFTMTYYQLLVRWGRVRVQFGWQDIPTATLKALRRSFARRIFANGCPLPVAQGLMRHENPETTMGYLRLVGGAFTTEEQRKWL